MSNQPISKDEFFGKVGALADEMIQAYDKDFAMGTLILAARFIAEGKSLRADEPQIITPGRR